MSYRAANNIFSSKNSMPNLVCEWFSEASTYSGDPLRVQAKVPGQGPLIATRIAVLAGANRTNAVAKSCPACNNPDGDTNAGPKTTPPSQLTLQKCLALILDGIGSQFKRAAIWMVKHPAYVRAASAAERAKMLSCLREHYASKFEVEIITTETADCIDAKGNTVADYAPGSIELTTATPPEVQQTVDNFVKVVPSKVRKSARGKKAANKKGKGRVSELGEQSGAELSGTDSGVDGHGGVSEDASIFGDEEASFKRAAILMAKNLA